MNTPTIQPIFLFLIYRGSEIRPDLTPEQYQTLFSSVSSLHNLLLTGEKDGNANMSKDELRDLQNSAESLLLLTDPELLSRFSRLEDILQQYSFIQERIKTAGEMLVNGDIPTTEFKKEYLKCLALSISISSPDFPFRGLLKLPQEDLDQVTTLLLEDNPPEAVEEG